jgi:predicted transcriptional regulator
MKETDEQIDQQIYHSILHNPGIHSRELARQLQIPYSTVQYHLNRFSQQGTISMERHGKMLHWFIAEENGIKEKKLLSVLRHTTARYIVYYLMVHLHASERHLSNNLEKHPTTIEFHLKKLLEVGLIEPVQVSKGMVLNTTFPKVTDCTPVTNEILYVLKDLPSMYSLMKKHQADVFSDDLGAVVLFFLDEIIAHGLPEYVGNPKHSVDAAIEMVFKIFPPPLQV